MEFQAPVNKNYIGRVVGSDVFNEDVSKLYFVDIEGRYPETHQWDYSRLSKKRLTSGFLNVVRNSKHYGVPHIGVSFPHVTALYRWSDPRFGEQETNPVKVGLGKTPDLENLSISSPKEDHFVIGCDAELYIMNQERRFRKLSTDMSMYLSMLVSNGRYEEGMGFSDPNLVRKFLETWGK